MGILFLNLLVTRVTEPDISRAPCPKAITIFTPTLGYGIDPPGTLSARCLRLTGSRLHTRLASCQALVVSWSGRVRSLPPPPSSCFQRAVLPTPSMGRSVVISLDAMSLSKDPVAVCQSWRPTPGLVQTDAMARQVKFKPRRKRLSSLQAARMHPLPIWLTLDN